MDELLLAGRFDELRARADDGDRRARFVLARLLQVAGHTDELLVAEDRLTEATDVARRLNPLSLGIAWSPRLLARQGLVDDEDRPDW